MTEAAVDKLVRIADRRVAVGDDFAARLAVRDAIRLLQREVGEQPSLRPRLIELRKLQRVLEYLSARVS